MKRRIGPSVLRTSVGPFLPAKGAALAIAAACALGSGFASATPARAAEPAADASLDQSLLEQLTEGLSTPAVPPPAEPSPAAAKPPVPKPTDLKPPPAKPSENQKPAAADQEKPPADGAAPGGLDGDLLKELTGGLETPAAGGKDDPVSKIAERMASVKDRLARAEAGGETRTLQDEIVADLDKLLKLQKQSQQQDPSSGSKQKASSKSSQSKKKPGEKQAGEQSAQNQSQGKQGPQPAGEGGAKPEQKTGRKPTDSDKQLDPKAVAAEADPSLDTLTQFVQAEWGHLPEKERNQVMQAFREKMLPQYDRLIRAYFEELARRGAQQ